ncbi:unnamed protein product [Protopolystoma xenopodis]|uniref:Uncharacterized protein n=1 Tax=Protopolystoma xenopodis TaxID=117903 RepID=A0A448WAT3_9PLAT|nr:unnamed protein product [Protopolystoma xenopodis]
MECFFVFSLDFFASRIVAINGKLICLECFSTLIGPPNQAPTVFFCSGMMAPIFSWYFLLLIAFTQLFSYSANGYHYVHYHHDDHFPHQHVHLHHGVSRSYQLEVKFDNFGRSYVEWEGDKYLSDSRRTIFVDKGHCRTTFHLSEPTNRERAMRQCFYRQAVE